ncbi:MAG: polyphosphate polymerase domain-containing protein [Spirochaetales bacterium]|nr:MAG: polyphosphate polymerase domain-containing protein [Spirochaetales bacterium]
MNNHQEGRQELKFLFPAGKKEAILDWLEAAFLPDPVYPFSRISSLYYDTPSFTLYHEKRSGDYLKTKVRLRWYGDLPPQNQGRNIICFFEVKQKTGSLCRKKRIELSVSTERLAADPFSDEGLINLPSSAVSPDYLPSGILLPMLLVQYNRYRFVDPEGDAGIALDTEIRCTRLNETFLPGAAPVSTGAGVLEIKGRSGEAPLSLRPVHVYLTKSEFSKYARCLEHLTEPPGRSA